MTLSKQNKSTLLDELGKAKEELKRFHKVWDKMVDESSTLAQAWQIPLDTALKAKIEIIKGALINDNANFFQNEADEINN